MKGDDRGKYELVGEEVERVKEIYNRLEYFIFDKLVSLFVIFDVKNEIIVMSSDVL